MHAPPKTSKFIRLVSFVSIAQAVGDLKHAMFKKKELTNQHIQIHFNLCLISKMLAW